MSQVAYRLCYAARLVFHKISGFDIHTKTVTINFGSSFVLFLWAILGGTDLCLFFRMFLFTFFAFTDRGTTKRTKHFDNLCLYCGNNCWFGLPSLAESYR